MKTTVKEPQPVLINNLMEMLLLMILVETFKVPLFTQGVSDNVMMTHGVADMFMYVQMVANVFNSTME